MHPFLGKLWDKTTHPLALGKKKGKRSKGRSPRSFPIKVTDVKPPTELETRSCARYNTIGEGNMTAVFDPDDKENKISRGALEMLTQAKPLREYACESVCLEWIYKWHREGSESMGMSVSGSPQAMRSYRNHLAKLTTCDNYTIG
ncbi:hypothetical protein F4823DRAFT_22830 [Ustulina deusta]|nr:hypothetical protein F4823DRAFT_22830 [Ustulina deusta]